MSSRGINKVILIGNLGQDPEVRHIPNGSAVANITIATSDNWRDKQTGEIREKTEWHRIVLFGKLAEIAGEFLKKGSQVYIEGSLQTRKWQDQNGQDRYITEIIVNINGTMQMLGNRPNITLNNKSRNVVENSNSYDINNINNNNENNVLSKTSRRIKNIISNDDNKINNIKKIDFDDDIPF